LTDLRGAAVEVSEAQLLAFYEWMLTGRLLEASLLDPGGPGGSGFLYPGSGQEAAQVGFAAAVDPGDVFAGGHRDLLARLVRGVTLEEAVLDLFGKAAGPSRGRRSFGTPALDRGVLGVSGASADGVGGAVGAALAFFCRGEARVALALCGEGAAATGVWHEAVNTAAVLGLPVVFGVENNQYAYSLPNERVTRLAYTAHRADGYGIPGVVVDGNDVLEVYAAAREAVERARSGEGPSLVEAVTFRYQGHHVDDPAEYVDPEARRSWQGRDPLPRYEEYLGIRGLLDEIRRSHLEGRVRARVERAVSWARQQADPAPAASPVVVSSRAEPPEPEAGGAGDEAETTLAGALTRVLDEAMAGDAAVTVLGPDAAGPGGLHGITRGLHDRYGPRRVVELPAVGPGLVGAAVGGALCGMRPVAEIPARHLGGALGLLAGHALGAEAPAPVVLRVPYGPGPFSAWDLVEAVAPARYPGLSVVVPATPAAAGGLLAAALRHPGPVVFLEPVRLYPATAPLPSVIRPEALDRARLARRGGDVTLVAWGAGVAAALEAAAEASGLGVEAEVIDLQALSPLDLDAVVASVARTGRLVVVEDYLPYGGVGAEVASRVAEEAFWHLDAPVRRLAPPGGFPFGHAEPAGPRAADLLAAILSSANT